MCWDMGVSEDMGSDNRVMPRRDADKYAIWIFISMIIASVVLVKLSGR